jgi:hypothetical protein
MPQPSSRETSQALCQIESAFTSDTWQYDPDPNDRDTIAGRATIADPLEWNSKRANRILFATSTGGACRNGQVADGAAG